jgi:predicted SAM-dependent methyltransferase
MTLQRTPDGRCYLHLWRADDLYEAQQFGLVFREWNNVKFARLPYPDSSAVRVRDLRKPLPFDSGVFDAVYANHVLEHLTPSEAEGLAAELRRVLNAGGIARLVVPDLESAARNYLHCLEEYRSDPSPENVNRYHWAVLELIDQMVRDTTGGLILEALRSKEFDTEHLKDRFGDALTSVDPPGRPSGRLVRTASMGPKWLAYALVRAARRALIRGDPRKTGEANTWMHDRVSLRLLLEDQGFIGYSVKTYAESDIPGWERYNLDSSSAGSYPREPSLYVEARKPA